MNGYMQSPMLGGYNLMPQDYMQAMAAPGGQSPWLKMLRMMPQIYQFLQMQRQPRMMGPGNMGMNPYQGMLGGY